MVRSGVVCYTNALRARLSAREKIRFDGELFQAHQTGRGSVREVLLAWAFTVAVRMHKSYDEDYQAFMGAVRGIN